MADKILSQTQISVFCSGIAMMLRSGVPISEAAALFAEDASGPLAEAAKAMSGDMQFGESFADAAAKTGVFPDYALGVFRTAELSGRLDEVLERLADYYDRQDALQNRLRSTLTYPVVLLLLMCGVLAVLVFAVLPMFERVYGSLTGSLAGSSYAYVLAAAVIGRVSLVVAVAVSAALLVLVVLMRSEQGREKLRGPMENSFFTKNAAWTLAVSKLTDTLSTLLASGTDPDSAMEMAAELTEHTGLKAILADCMEKMRMGEGLANTLFRHNVLPQLYGRMLVGGSESGNLGATLEKLSDRLGKDAENELCAIIDKTEPILIGFLTVSVGLTLLSVMLPLLGILGAV